MQVETEIAGRVLRMETGRMARQADGSTVLTYGDTILLATAVASKGVREGIDFFPLTIDYLEKTYAAGKIPGGFFKREGRPSEKEVLTSRLIDRPIRPLFPKGFKSETQGIVNVLSFGDENTSDVMGITGVSAALVISDIPFDGPVSGVRVGKLGGEYVLFPSLKDIEDLELEIAVAGTDEAVVMVEGKAGEVPEADFLEAIDIAHREIKRLNALQRELREKVGRPKRAIPEQPKIDEEFKAKVREYVLGGIQEGIKIPDKLRRQDALDHLLTGAKEHFSTPEEDRSREVADVFYELERQLVRRAIVEENVRADGRRPDEIRPISCTVGLLPRVHGSALFVRGETQALAVSTLGTTEDEQKIDALEGEYYKSFMLHYNFPPFSVGEARFLRGPGRREVGHGALAEKAVRPLLPSHDDFPYTIRVVSDILESNGSSSMATVCAASLSLMDAAVPMKSPVAGIAMGLIKEGDRTVVLTDILGLEDHLGDMDFKVTGTERGVTAFQMDVKIAGITGEVLQEALEQARKGRLFILEAMKQALPAPRETLSPYAPRIYTMMVKQDKIRDIIGTGGKVIKGIIEETGVKINIEDSGLVSIASPDEAAARKAIKIIEGIIEEPEVGKLYKGKVVRITDFGAFVEILPGTDGLLHISQIDHKRIEKVTDVLHEGDEVLVKVIEIDKLGRVRLSRKEALKEKARPQA
ncbi:MAG: polyribonucleotide nucleotidyltransferase [Nitrospirota bacterium]|jgi:polyribonucleotide nucleotidyltransferase